MGKKTKQELGFHAVHDTGQTLERFFASSTENILKFSQISREWELAIKKLNYCSCRLNKIINYVASAFGSCFSCMKSHLIIFEVVPSGSVLARENKILNVVFSLSYLFICQARTFRASRIKRIGAVQNAFLVWLNNASLVLF